MCITKSADNQKLYSYGLRNKTLSSMRNNLCNKSLNNQQSGFVLVLALVMLSMLTLIGVSSMNSASTELKATANAKQHQLAFNATQSLLEYTVSKPGTNKIDYQTRDTTAYCL